MNKKYNLVENEILYNNPLKDENCLDDFIFEGPMTHLVVDDELVLQSDEQLDPDKNTSHWVLWNRQIFPSNIAIEYDFKPLQEPGLAMLFFSGSGEKGKDIFDPILDKRDGQYGQYHSGDINTYHLSYFRRRWEDERSFHTCNLRKSSGFHLAAQAPDPIPSVKDSNGFYKIKLMKYEGIVQFYINDMLIFEWEDDGVTFGEILEEGRIGFRQMAPLKAAYRNLSVSSVMRKE